jgi:hypothetical protein
MASNVGTVNVTLLVARCKDCKWWGSKAWIGPGRNHCDHPKVANGNGEDADGAMDSEEYGGIDTGPEFGCVHWEGK